MSAISKKSRNKVVVLPIRKDAGKRSYHGRGHSRSFRISRELVADRLRCMLEHVHVGEAQQVLLHTMAIANALPPGSPHSEPMRDFLQEAHGLFLRGDSASAEQRLHDALNYFTGR